MATLIDWSELETKINSYITLHDCETKSVALAYVLLEYLFNLNIEDIEDAITDGSADRGIDAVYVQTEGIKTIVHLFQFKHVETFEKTGDNFPSNEIDKLFSFITDLLKKDEALKESCNPLLWGKVQEIWSVFESGTVPHFEVHLVANQAAMTSIEQERLSRSLKPYRISDIHHHTLESIANLLIRAKKPRIDRNIRLVDDNYFERVDGNIRGIVATVQALDLIEAIKDPDQPDKVNISIFDDNVRIYLTSKNRINQKIIESALSDQNSEFWYLNNGITMTCESMEYPPKSRAPLLNVTNVQIVNGGQTSHALFEAYKKDSERLRNVLVLVRVYETRHPELSSKIAESTNSQTPIKSRDLRSNDEIQLKLESSFLDLGYYYERKANQYKDADKSKRIDALLAGQAYVAYTLKMPHIAAKDRGKIFGELYDSIFNDEITVESLLTPLKVFEPIEKKKRLLERGIRRGGPYDQNLLFLIDGAYHLLSAVAVLCRLRGVNPSNPDQALSQLDDAIKVLKIAVDAEQKRDPAFAHKKFFKSTRAQSFIEGIASKLASHEKQID